MKFEISDTPMVQVWVEFPELQEIMDKEIDLYINITEEIYTQIVMMDGVGEVDEMNDCFHCELYEAKHIKKKIEKIIVPSAVRYINCKIQDCEDDYQDKWTKAELKQLKKFKKHLTYHLK